LTVIFPPGAIPVAILLNGTPLQSYNHPYVLGGRVRAPVAPYVTRIADRIGFERGSLVASRAGLTVRIRTAQVEPQDLSRSYVCVAQVFAGLGASVHYDAQRHVLEVRLARTAGVTQATPFQPPQPNVSPTRIFTPEPVITPRPVYTGTPHPRRTPIILSTSRPQQ
jgi:hypothetical protein